MELYTLPLFSSINDKQSAPSEDGLTQDDDAGSRFFSPANLLTHYQEGPLLATSSISDVFVKVQ